MASLPSKRPLAITREPVRMTCEKIGQAVKFDLKEDISTIAEVLGALEVSKDAALQNTAGS